VGWSIRWFLVAVLTLLLSAKHYAVQGNVYVLSGSSRDAFTADINGVALRTTTVKEIDDSVASITPEAIEILSQPSEGSYAIDVTLNAADTRPIHPLFFGFNLSDMGFGYTRSGVCEQTKRPSLRSSAWEAPSRVDSI
jgi:hypothetical protein